jgi:NADH dehydrogenase
VDEKGRVKVGPTLCVEERENVWALGDCARVPNQATPGQFDPPTCQHALGQARRLAKKLRVVTDWTVGLFFRRDIAELSMLGHAVRLGDE